MYDVCCKSKYYFVKVLLKVCIYVGKWFIWYVKWSCECSNLG